MSAPRKLARLLLFFSAALVLIDLLLLVGSEELASRLVCAVSIVGHVTLVGFWRLRLQGRLRSSGRRAVWPIAAVVFGAASLGALFSGSLAMAVVGVTLNSSALVLAISGVVAEHRRADELLRFVVRPV